ncbi:CBO0543 family protein [Paenibacillus sp. P36]|uniref:CBO0543 family protein n=1 Tax=Paenibacillus sp. P36 TaxID=3342538 RepID=UPI0038B35019
MIFIAMAVISVLSAWRWGDWRNWQKYHATMLYFLLGDVFYVLLTKDYPLWQHQPKPPIDSTIGTEICCLVAFAATTLIFLGLYPKGIAKAALWIGLWVVIYSLIEVIYIFTGAIKHFHGWTMLYSVVFNIITFPMLRLHFSRPILTYAISILFAIGLLVIFKVPIQ